MHQLLNQDFSIPSFGIPRHDSPSLGTNAEQWRACRTASRSPRRQTPMLRPEIQLTMSELAPELRAASAVVHCALQASLDGDVLCKVESTLEGVDVLCLACLQRAHVTSSALNTVVLCGVHELRQIRLAFERFGAHVPGLRAVAMCATMPLTRSSEVLALRCPQVLIATPGRAVELARAGALQMREVAHLAIAECGDCPCLGATCDMRELFAATPTAKRTVVVAAAIARVRLQCGAVMAQLHEVSTRRDATLSLRGMDQYVSRVSEEHKIQKLVDILDSLDFEQAAVFARTSDRTIAVETALGDLSFPLISVHGNLTEKERMIRLRRFASFEKRILVAEELYGVKSTRVDVVINFDVPLASDIYMNCVGGPRLSGKKGVSVSFVASDQDEAMIVSFQEDLGVQFRDFPSGRGCVLMPL